VYHCYINMRGMTGGGEVVWQTEILIYKLLSNDVE
jgi:hypothetical protein